MSFRRRTFPEVLDHLLTDIAGGVAAEPHPFPPPGATQPPFRHSLEQPPVAEITSVYGNRDGEPRTFRRDIDYALAEDGQTLEWLEGAELPDRGTLVHVNYLPEAARPEVTDLQTGSVVRTLAESMGLEMARIYGQLEGVYRAGFIDSASGSALDRVVALLGIERVRGGRAAGEIEFSRAGGSRGAITIPAGTRVLSASGDVEYATTETVTLAAGQNRVRAPARDLEANEPLPADSLTVLAVPIAGIARVANPAPTAIGTQDETDRELRTRAKAFLHGSERATLGALRQAIARQQITADVDEVEDSPGIIEVTPHVDELSAELEERLLAAIRDARPAGVVVNVLKDTVAPQRVSLELRLATAAGIPVQQIRAAHREVRRRVEDYFAELPVRDAGSINRVVGLILGVPEVEDVTLLRATVNGDPTNRLNFETGEIAIADVPTKLGELHIADPNLPTVLTTVVRFPLSAAPPDEPQIQSALEAALSYLNNLDGGDPAALGAARTLSFNKLLHVVPLPGKSGEPLHVIDAGEPGTITLPTAAEAAPYDVQFAFTLESGLTQVLVADEQAYTVIPHERILLGGVELAGEPG